MNEREAALLAVGRHLREIGYAFITPTPETHRRNLARAQPATTLRDVFGWNRPFDPALLPTEIFAALEKANAVQTEGALARARVRFSSLGDDLFVHSAYPTIDENAVFFGPDTYRFCALIDREVSSAQSCIDVGCGSGAGGLSIAGRVERLFLTDINAGALSFARVNAHLAGVDDRVELLQGDLFAPVADKVDLIVANPPYLLDGAGRVYRDGGGELGEGLAVRIVREGLPKLTPGGRLVLYTGSPIVNGVDIVRRELEKLGARMIYRELDPDVFGEELELPAYAAVERIAVVAAVVIAM